MSDTPQVKYVAQPLEGSQEPWIRLTRNALRFGESESTTEWQYTRALAWLEAKRGECETDEETATLNNAVLYVTTQLDHVRNPPVRSRPDGDHTVSR